MDKIPGIRKFRNRYRVHFSLSEKEAEMLSEYIQKNPGESTSDACRKLIIKALESIKQ